MIKKSNCENCSYFMEMRNGQGICSHPKVIYNETNSFESCPGFTRINDKQLHFEFMDEYIQPELDL